MAIGITCNKGIFPISVNRISFINVGLKFFYNKFLGNYRIEVEKHLRFCPLFLAEQ